MNEYIHEPVLLTESLALLRANRGGLFVDATLGLGGHSEALLLASPENRVVGIDCDPAALLRAKARLSRFGSRFTAIEGRHEDLAIHLEALGITRVQGVLADLGVSSMQLDDPSRGFSFRKEGPLDMRMGSTGPAAADLIARLSRDELERIFRHFGEENMSGRIARVIVETREREPFVTTAQLRAAVVRAKGQRGERIDPATRVFQALRIATNQELTGLDQFLNSAIEHLEVSARLAVLSYHSLEDRIVKSTFVRHSVRCTCPPDLPVCVCSQKQVMELVTRKPIEPGKEEIVRNPRSRSAKLRVIERVAAP